MLGYVMWPPQLTTKLLQRVPQNWAINCSHCTLHLSVGTHSYVFPHPFWYQLYLQSAMLSLKDRTVTITVLGNAHSRNGLVTVEQWMNTFCFAWIMKSQFFTFMPRVYRPLSADLSHLLGCVVEALMVLVLCNSFRQCKFFTPSDH